MATDLHTGWALRGGLAVATAVLLSTGCERTPPPLVAPAPTLAGGPTVAPPAEPARAGERRPERVSFLTRADSCARFAEAVRPLALQAVGPYGFSSGGWAEADGAGTTMAEGGMARPGPALGPLGAATPASPVAGTDFSATNVQEAGVDEPDVVKTDGRLLVTTADGRLRVVDVSGVPRPLGVLDLPGGSGDVLLVGRRALVLSGGDRSGSAKGSGVVSAPGATGAPTPGRPTTTITVVDLADPAKPSIAHTSTIDGALVDARLVGGVARVVTRSQPNISFPPPAPGDEQTVDPAKAAYAANAATVRQADPAAFLPKGASCADAYVPAKAAGVGTIAVQSVDPAADAPGPAVTVLADASTVYASATRLFVATNRHGSGGTASSAAAQGAPAQDGGAERTAIHAFDITDPAKARYAGSGDVPGRLLNSFSLSEDAGVLRVATTVGSVGFSGGGPIPVAGGAPWVPASPSQSRVTILRPAGQEWVETGAVDGLGTGERIYAVRFLGATAYVVTFRQTDPLYVLDLRDVRAPKMTGELKITGYSAYLHPAGDRRLLGIGQEATDEGRRQGTQLSLFDVGDPAAPAKLAGAVLPSGSSSAEADHHAFLYWPATGLVVTPVRSSEGVRSTPGGPAPATRPFVGAVAFHIGDRSVTEAGRVTHPGSTPIERSLVVGDRLLTLSPVGLASNDLRTLADGGFLAFR